MATRGAISIEVVADTARFAADLKAQLRTVLRSIRTDPIEVDADTSPFVRRIREAQAEADKSFRGLFDTLKGRAEKAGSGIGTALMLGIKLAVASGGAPLLAAVTGIISAIGPAALAVIPAVVGVFATLKVALSGVSDALKNVGDAEKFNEALEKLSPNAQKFAVAVKNIMPALSALKNAVQDRFFLGLDKEVTAVSKNLLGPLKSGMTQTAGGLNGIVKEITRFAASAKGAALVNAVFDVTNKVIAQISGAFGPLLDRVSDWIVKASNSGVNSAFMTAKETLSSLAETAKNVSSAVGSLFGGLGKDGPAVAQSLAEASKALKDFLASAQAQAILNTLGTAMDKVRAIALQILGVLPSLLPAVNGLATGGFGVLLGAVQLVVDALTPVAELLGGQEELFTVVGAAIGTYVVAIKAYQAAQVLATAAQIAWKVATTAATIATQVATAAYNTMRVAVLLAQTAFYSAGAAVTTAAAALWGQVTALAATAAAWIRVAVQSALNTVRLVAYVVAVNAVRVATIAWTAVQWLLNAAMTANPIGIVIAIIVALVAAIVIAYQKSETFRSIVQAAFAGIAAAATWLWENALKPLWDGIVAGFEFVKAAAALWWAGVQAYFNLLAAGASALWGWIKAAWDGIVAAFNFVVAGAASFVSSVVGFFQNLVSSVAGKISSMISFVTGIPGRIMSAVGNLGSLLYNAGANIIQGLINGITSMIGRLTGAVSGAVQKIRDYLPFSPAKVGPLSGDGAPEASGRKIALGVAEGIKAEQSSITSAMNTMAGNLEMSDPSMAARNPNTNADGSSGGIRVWPGQQPTNPDPLVINSGGSKMDDLLVEVLSKAVRVRGGDVQKVLGKTKVGVS